MADELNIPTHRWYQPRYNISLPNTDFSKQWIFNSGIQKIDAFIGGGSFSPSTLFALAEPGVWFDPSDLTTLFQDPAGTTPVTTPGNTVGLMLDKSKGLALGAELVANGDFSSGTTGWAGSGATIAVVSGELEVTGGAGTGRASQTAIPTTAGVRYKLTLNGRTVTSNANIYIYNTANDANLLSLATSGSTSAIYSGSFVATGTSVYIWLACSTGVVGYFDNVSVRELAGNHATQATLAARPTYSIEPVGGRRNIFTYSQDFRNTAGAGEVRPWGHVGTTITSTSSVAPDGTSTATLAALVSAAEIQQETLSNGSNNVVSVYVKAAPSGSATHIRLSTNDGAAWNTGVSQKIALTSEWQRLQIGGDILPNSSGNVRVVIGGKTVEGNNDAECIGNVLIWGAQYETGSTATAYQRVTTQHDVTEAGVASLGYLYFDGVNDAMATSTITPGTDKAQVFAGVRKLSTFANVVAETSANSDVNNGAFALGTNSSGGLNYLVQARGTNLAFYIPAGYPTPSTDVISGLLDVAGATLAAEIVPRINGVVNQTGGGGGNVGTGNFLAYPLYLGGRAGTSFLFTGHLYSLITRFGPTLDAPTIASTEIWVGDKTGIDVAKNISTTIYTRSGDTILDRANSTIERRAV